MQSTEQINVKLLPCIICSWCPVIRIFFTAFTRNCLSLWSYNSHAEKSEADNQDICIYFLVYYTLFVSHKSVVIRLALFSHVMCFSCVADEVRYLRYRQEEFRNIHLTYYNKLGGYFQASSCLYLTWVM
jgi:hypothetical protein